MSKSSSENEVDLDVEYGYNPPVEGPLIRKTTLRSWGGRTKEELKYRCSTKNGWLETLYSLIPVLYWLPHYEFRENIIGDFIAGLILFISFLFCSLSIFLKHFFSPFFLYIHEGISVGVMLVPQGMAYAIVAGMPPVYGLYTALVPIYIYALLGTSRQLSVGPVAVM